MKGNMSQSQKGVDLSPYAKKTTKINGQTLDNDVQIDNVESADKLKTARTINGVKFDGSSDIKVYGETELPKQMTAFDSKGWYRFARITSASLTATIHIVRGYSYGLPEAYTMILDFVFGSCKFTQLSSIVNEGSQYIPKIRAVHNNNAVFLEFYYDSETSNYVTAKVTDLLTSYPTDNYAVVAYEDGSIPEGYFADEFNLSASPIKASSLQIGNTTITEAQLQALLATLS